MEEINTIEQKVAAMVLEDPITVTIGGKNTLEVPHPTLGTLIRISAAISQLPNIDIDKGSEMAGKDTVLHALAVADRAMPVAEILALAILGDGNTEQTVTRTVYKPMPGIAGRLGFKKREEVEWHVDRVKPLAAQLAAKMSGAAMTEAIISVLNQADLGSFFELIGFLGGVNLLRKPTTKASGQS